MKGGVLGHENQTTTNVTLPTELQFPESEKIVYISVGYKHVAAINEKGELLIFIYLSCNIKCIKASLGAVLTTEN